MIAKQNIKAIKCPLCNCLHNANVLFFKENVFASVGRIDPKPNLIPNLVKIELVQCQNCGYIFNNAFNLKKINEEYNSSNYVLKKIISPLMSKNLTTIKDEILEFTTTASSILEIGCGDGALACAISPYVNHVYTMDPSIESIQVNSMQNITHINDYYSLERASSVINEKVDMIILRHLLEHISKPFEFIDEINSMLNQYGTIYIEVPNVEEIIESRRFYDIFHDHFGYFSKSVLINFLANIGFSLKKTIKLFNEQHIGLFFVKDNKKNKTDKINNFYSYSICQKFLNNITKINEIISNNHNIAIYGAGAHGNSLLNYIEPSNIEKIKICLDKDKSKQDKYLQASSIKIQEPSMNNFKKIDLIIIASSLYEQEIINEILRLGYKGNILKTANLSKEKER